MGVTGRILLSVLPGHLYSESVGDCHKLAGVKNGTV